MPELGRKYTCYSCHTKFYDLGKPVPLCPKCGADQRDADDTPAYTPARRGRVVAPPEPEPAEDEEFTPAAEPAEESADEEDFAPDAREEEADEEEEEEY